MGKEMNEELGPDFDEEVNKAIKEDSPTRNGIATGCQDNPLCYCPNNNVSLIK